MAAAATAALAGPPLPMPKPAAPAPAADAPIPRPRPPLLRSPPIEDVPADEGESLQEPGKWPAAAVAAAEAECRTLLQGIAVSYAPLPPLGGPEACGTPFPIEVSEVAGVAVRPAATLNCKTTAALYRWVTETAKPAARKAFGEPVAALANAASYHCRRRNNAGTGKLSEHAFANALDVSAFVLASGRIIPVGAETDVVTASLGLSAAASFLGAAHKGACAQFSTVLGPQYNALHADHFHLDLGRGGRYKICK